MRVPCCLTLRRAPQVWKQGGARHQPLLKGPPEILCHRGIRRPRLLRPKRGPLLGERNPMLWRQRLLRFEAMVSRWLLMMGRPLVDPRVPPRELYQVLPLWGPPPRVPRRTLLLLETALRGPAGFA